MSKSRSLLKSTHDINKLYMDLGDYSYTWPHVAPCHRDPLVHVANNEAPWSIADPLKYWNHL